MSTPLKHPKEFRFGDDNNERDVKQRGTFQGQIHVSRFVTTPQAPTSNVNAIESEEAWLIGLIRTLQARLDVLQRQKRVD